MSFTGVHGRGYRNPFILTAAIDISSFPKPARIAVLAAAVFGIIGMLFNSAPLVTFSVVLGSVGMLAGLIHMIYQLCRS